MCHPETTAGLSNYNFHLRATALHRLNLQVLPGWTKSKDGDEETTFSIVWVPLVPLSPGRMSPPLLHRQTQNTWGLLQASVLCLSICRQALHPCFQSEISCILWRAPCYQFHRGCHALIQFLQGEKWVNSSPFKHKTEGHNFSIHEMFFFALSAFFLLMLLYGWL